MCICLRACVCFCERVSRVALQAAMALGVQKKWLADKCAREGAAKLRAGGWALRGVRVCRGL